MYVDLGRVNETEECTYTIKNFVTCTGYLLHALDDTVRDCVHNL
jgi:hypothetical protein